MKKLLALALAVTMLMTACGGQSEAPEFTLNDTLNVNMGESLETLRPEKAFTSEDLTYMNHLYMGLVRLNDDGTVIPGVSKEWEKKTNATKQVQYVFTLDENAKWSDGTAVTADDFITAWEYALIEDNSPMAYLMYPIKNAKLIAIPEEAPAESEAESTSESETESVSESVAESVPESVAESTAESVSESTAESAEEKAEEKTEDKAEDKKDEAPAEIIRLGVDKDDDGKLVVTLENDCPDFLQRLALPVFFPVPTAADEKIYLPGSEEKPLTNGAYMVEEWIPDSRLTLVKNPNYLYKDEVTAEKINFVLGNSHEEVFEAYKNGYIDFTASLGVMNAIKKEADPNKQYAGGTAYANSTQALVINTEKFTGLDVRKALAEAIDTKAVAEAVNGVYIPAESFIPKGTSFVLEKPEEQAEAKAEEPKTEEAKEENKTDLKGTEIELLIVNAPAQLKAAESVKAQWEAEGAAVTIKAAEPEEFAKLLEEGNFDVARVNFYSDSIFPLAMLEGFATDSAKNFGGYSDVYFDKLIASANGIKYIAPEKAEGEEETKTSENAEHDEKDISKLSMGDSLMEAEKVLLEDAAVIPLTHSAVPYLNSGVEGVKSLYNGSFYFGNASK